VLSDAGSVSSVASSSRLQPANSRSVRKRLMPSPTPFTAHNAEVSHC